MTPPRTRPIARALLSTALDQVDPDAVTLTALLEALPGARERAQAGLADISAGRVVALDDLLPGRAVTSQE